jgi:hypothetical protein
MNNFTYKGFYVMFDVVPHNGRINMTADNDRETIREAYMGYTRAEIRAKVKQLIDEVTQ